jgi:hypothetical protein
MEITAQNVNSVARNLAKTLISAGYKMMISSYNISPQQVAYNEIVNLISKKLPNAQQGLMDSNYYLTGIDKWKDIIASDWLMGTKKYIADKFDCDNFAYCFASHCSELYDISVATCYGRVWQKDTGADLGLHYWNVIMTQETDGRHLYFYEPQNDNYLEIPDGTKDIVMGQMKYEAIKVIVF